MKIPFIIKILAITAFCTATLILPYSAHAGDKDKIIKEIQKLIANGEDFSALQKAESAVKNHPESPALHFYIGKLKKKLYPQKYTSKSRVSKRIYKKQTTNKKTSHYLKDKDPPTVVDLTLKNQKIPIDGNIIISVKIMDKSGIHDASVFFPEISDPFCSRTDLQNSGNNIYKASIPMWCLGNKRATTYFIQATDNYGNRIRTPKNHITTSVPWKRWEIAIIAGLPALLGILLLMVRYSRIRSAKKKKILKEKIKDHQNIQDNTPMELEIIDTLDPSLLEEVEDKREKKFFERRRRLFTVTSRKKKDK